MDKKRSFCCGAVPATLWWLLTLLGLPLLFLLMISSRQGEIENDLAGRSNAGLKAAGMDWAQANLAGRGRDLQLRGTAASAAERDEAVKLAQGIYGVREVQSLIEVAAPETAMPDSAIAGSDSQLAGPVAPAPAPPEQPVAPEVPVAPEMPTAPVAPAQPEQPIAPSAPEAPAAPEPPLASAGTEPEKIPAQQSAQAAEASTAEQVVQGCQQQLNDAMSGQTILFETNKAAIKQDSIALLDSLAGIMSSCKGVIADRGIEVSGHTDNVGNDAYNRKLSQRRADAVRDYLVKQGIDGALLKSVGYGESKPVASNDTEEGRSQNRRINFEISPE